MFHTIKDFTGIWKQESDGTRKLLASLTDESLTQQVTDDHRTLGRIAWHIVLTLGELKDELGLRIDCPKQGTPPPATAREIFDAYDKAAKSLADLVRSDWNDEKLQEDVVMYGEKVTYGYGLWNGLTHEIHHRGQMTILMRQAGLKVPGIYGPAYEEWVQYDKTPPVI